MKKFINISRQYFDQIRLHLLSDNYEHIAFLGAKIRNLNGSLYFDVQATYLIPDEHTEISNFSIQLNEDIQSKVIKWAWDHGYSLIEIHSHPFSMTQTMFSSTDTQGFTDFVPHVWWRLNNKPYAALVFGQKSLDALCWIEKPSSPEKIDGVQIENKILFPTHNTWDYLFENEKYGRKI